MRSTVKKALIIGLAISALLFVAMADSGSSSEEAKAAVQIVYTEKPGDGEEPEAFHIKTLASVLGSEEAAKDAILYSYKEAASGFSAKLTPQQVAELSRFDLWLGSLVVWQVFCVFFFRPMTDLI
ncbi:hypothetical protein AMTRI_Chr11g155390 [Amborella trichopoda]